MDDLLPTPPSAPPEWSLIDHANDAFENDKAGNLKGAGPKATLKWRGASEPFTRR